MAWDAVMFTAFRRSRQVVRRATLMLLGVVGKVIVRLGWLKAMALGKILSGSPADRTFVAALVLGQAAVALAAFAPAG